MENEIETGIIWSMIGSRVSENYGYNSGGFPRIRILVCWGRFFGFPVYMETIQRSLGFRRWGLWVVAPVIL